MSAGHCLQEIFIKFIFKFKSGKILMKEIEERKPSGHFVTLGQAVSFVKCSSVLFLKMSVHLSNKEQGFLPPPPPKTNPIPFSVALQTYLILLLTPCCVSSAPAPQPLLLLTTLVLLHDCTCGAGMLCPSARYFHHVFNCTYSQLVPR